MKRMVASAVAAAFVVALAAPALADEKTVKGEVVDVQCYTKDKANVGKDHEACALSCARRGNQMGILAADGTVYLISGDYSKENNKKLIEFVAKQVEAKGEVMEHDGKKMITVTAMEVAK